MKVQQAKIHGRVDPEDLDFIVEEVEMAIRELRVLIGLLRAEEDSSQHIPSTLPITDGIQAAVGRLERVGFTVRWTADSEVPVVPVVAAACNAILREAVNNVIKHGSRAAPVVLDFYACEGTIHLKLGNGVAAPERLSVHSSLGIVGMTESARSVGGRLTSQLVDDHWVLELVIPSAEEH